MHNAETDLAIKLFMHVALYQVLSSVPLIVKR